MAIPYKEEQEDDGHIDTSQNSQPILEDSHNDEYDLPTGHNDNEEVATSPELTTDEEQEYYM